MAARNEGALGFVAIACGSILFGTLGVATKGILTISDANATSIALWRVLIALPILFVIGLVVLRASLFSISRRDLRLMMAAGVLMAFYQIAFVTAVQMASVTIAALVTVSVAPLIVAVLASVFLKEHMHRNVYAAMACAIVGVALLLGFEPSGNTGTNVLLGIGLALLTALANGFSRLRAGHWHRVITPFKRCLSIFPCRHSPSFRSPGLMDS
jgi:DME family drug/metabolite transporter